MGDNPYEVLQVDPDASPRVIEAARRTMARQYHPDVGSTPDPSKMAEINRAHEQLTDPAQRSAIDSRLRASGVIAADQVTTTPGPPVSSASHTSASFPTVPGTTPTAPSMQPTAPPPARTGAPPPPPPSPRGSFVGATVNSRVLPLSWISFLVTVLGCSPIGLILALVARSQINKSHGTLRGKGWTTAVFIWVVLQIVLVGVILMSVSVEPTTTNGF